MHDANEILITERERFVLTGVGAGRVAIFVPATVVGCVVLGHGAGGDTRTPSLLAVRDALTAAQVAVALVDQPYRVAGRRAPDRSPRLDMAMKELLAGVLAELPDAGVPVFVGGKSSGARVGARIARDVAAAGVVALGFPLTPPTGGSSRAAELDAGCPVLVVQGSRDVFGTPEAVRAAAAGLPVDVHEIAGGDHSFVPRKSDNRTRLQCLDEVAGVVADWVLARI